MKKVLFLLFAASLTISLSAQTPNSTTHDDVVIEAPAETSGPEMTFETMEIDYGTIAQDSDPFRIFTFTNTGDAPLLITNARGSCGCTVPSYSTAPVAPGESSEIKVRYDTHRMGQFRKRVTLTTNASEEPIILTIKGLVEAAPEAVPAQENGLFNGGE